MKYIIILSLLSITFFIACKAKKTMPVTELSKAALLLNQTIEAHGGKLYDNSFIAFTFRGNEYSFKNRGDAFSYQSTKIKDGQTTIDKMSNDDFSRTVNGEPVELTEKQKANYGASLNSVIYFATLPHKLKDPAVNVIYKGTTSIKNSDYEILEISFDEEEGGKDHDDIYYYWINMETNHIDFFAYNYQVNNGGVRFRSAYNKRVVGGIVFLDYINYKAPFGTPLSELPSLLEQGSLEKLSVIETENVRFVFD